jgi:WD40 repeat protein
MFRFVLLLLIVLAIPSSQASAQPTPENTHILDLAWSPDGSRIAIVGVTNENIDVYNPEIDKIYGYLSVIDAVSGAKLYTMQPQGISFASVAWSPDGTRLALASDNSVVWVLDAEDGHQLGTLEGHFATVITGVDWNSTGTQIVSSGNWDEQVILWDAESLTMVRQIETTGIPADVTFSADDRTIILGADNGLFLLDPASREPGKVTEQPPTLPIWVLRLAPSPDGSFVAVGSFAVPDLLTGIRNDGHTYVVDILTGTVIYDFVSSWGSIGGLSWSPDNQYLAVVHQDNLMTLWDLKQEPPLIVETHSVPTGDIYPKSGVGFSPYGGRLAIISQSATRSGMPGVEIIVPAPSLERLAAIAEACVRDGDSRAASLTDSAPTRSGDLAAFVATVEALALGAIPEACRADLLAVADALRE